MKPPEYTPSGDWETAYAILNREYPNNWPAALSGAISLRIRELVEAGNVQLAACVAAQTAAGFYADAVNHQCDLPDSIKEALNSGDGTYRP